MSEPLPSVAAPAAAFDPLQEAHRQWSVHEWGAADEMLAASSLIRAQQIVVSRLDGVLRQKGLSFARFEILVALAVSRRGALPLGKLSGRLSVHPTSVTALVDRLVTDAHVRRERSRRDRRTVLARITDKGRATVEEMAPRLADVRFGLADLGDGGAGAVSDLLRPLREGAGDFLDD